MATGYSICGASAIAAVEPFADASEEEVAYSIALVTLCGTLAIFTLPGLGSLLGLTATEFGAWVGASVHDVGQAVAAASTHGEVSLKLATLVKLTRVALLAPLLAGVAIAARRRQGDAALEGAKRPPLLPLFILLFLVASAITSTGVLSACARRHQERRNHPARHGSGGPREQRRPAQAARRRRDAAGPCAEQLGAGGSGVVGRGETVGSVSQALG